MILLPNLKANLLGKPVVLDIVGEFMDADITSGIAVSRQIEQVLLPAGSQQAAEAPRPLIYRQLAVERFALEMPKLRQVGSHLIFTDDMQLSARDLEVIAYVGQVSEHAPQAVASGKECLVCDDRRSLDRNPIIIQTPGIEALLRWLDGLDPIGSGSPTRCGRIGPRQTRGTRARRRELKWRLHESLCAKESEKHHCLSTMQPKTPPDDRPGSPWKRTVIACLPWSSSGGIG